jgi:predicted adenylyl cyclase CyaB
MARNIEIKAMVRDYDALRQLAEVLSDTPCTTIQQEDTFFNVSENRLKLRTLAQDRGQLIFYARSDQTGPKQSNYLLTMTHEPAKLQNVLASALGIRGVVRKTRELFLVGKTRIHLDQVEGLGAYMELEVVLGAHETAVDGTAVAADLMSQLGIQESDLIDVAYIDLLEQK